MDAFFSELTRNFKELSKRVSRFETWEPSTGFVDTGAHAYLTANQALGAGVYTVIAFNAELWDTDGIHSAGTMTIPVDGKYLFTTALFTSGLAGTLYTMIYRTANLTPVSAYGGTVVTGNLSVIMDCVTGDTLTVQANPSGPTTILGVAAYPYTSYFQVQRVG